MGLSFSNYNIRRSAAAKPERILDALCRYAKSRGYIPCEEADADVEAAVYAPEDSGWISVWSELMSAENGCDMSSAAAWLSKVLKTDVLTAMCCDSDFIFLNLINTRDGVDAWANVGNLYCEPERETDIAAWSGRVKDLQRFEADLNEDGVFAEDFMYTLDEQLGLPGEQGCFDQYSAKDLSENDSVTRLFFSLPDKAADNDLPWLEIKSFGLMPCKKDETMKQTALNKGGASKGLAVAFTGVYVRNDEITFSDVKLEYIENGKWVIVPITLKKYQMVDGGYMYYWEDKEFPIPPAVNPELPMKKLMEKEFYSSFGVRFTPHGDPRKMLDIRLQFMPLENPKGQAVWYVYKLSKTKAAFIEDHNNGSGKYTGILNPDDFDLD
ncbi:MAG: hypothetical protein ACI4WS_08705 [Oscillospiraceae bacterium]